MDEALFSQLVESLQQGRDILQGKTEPARVTVVNEPEITVFRRKHQLSRADAARILCVSERTIESWEQGRREPSGAARMLLHVAVRHPQAVLETAQDIQQSS